MDELEKVSIGQLRCKRSVCTAHLHVYHRGNTGTYAGQQKNDQRNGRGEETFGNDTTYAYALSIL